MSYEVCYIDDKILPIGGTVSNEFGIISKDEITRLVGYDEWHEAPIKRFLTETLRQANRFKEVSLSGFTNPDFFLNHVAEVGYNPNMVILDWDFGSTSAEEKLEDLLSNTTGKVYVLTGNELEDQVEETLIPIKAKYNQPDRGLGVYTKQHNEGEEKTQENLVERIIAEIESIPISVRYLGMDINFHPSLTLPDYDSFWMVESIVGSDFIVEFLKKNMLNITKALIEKMFKESGVKFFVNSANTRIYSENGLQLKDLHNENVEPITAVYAIKNYDLAILERAFEKGSSHTFQDNEE